MKRFTLIIPAFLFSLLLYAVCLGEDEKEYSFEISKAPGKISVLVPDFRKDGDFIDRENRDKLMADILAEDLNFSGYFEAKRVTEVLGDPTAWASLNVDNIVQGSYTTDGREIHLAAKITDTKSSAQLLSKRYPDALRVMRQTVHRIADDVTSQLAGEKGVCSTKIALISDMTGKNELYYSDYDGHNVYRMTRDESMCLLPSWSPKGDYITFTSYRRMNPDLWWVSYSAKSRGIISFFPGQNASASWSPDGQTIALSISKDGNAEIYSMKRDGTGLKRLTFNRGIDTGPSWSPNGREIVFNSDRGGSPQLYIMDAEGGNVRRLTYNGGYNGSPDWSPKGDKVVYVSRESGKFNIFTIEPTGNNVTRLTHNTGHNENPSWSPDGRHIVFSSTRSGKNALYTMDPDGKNVRRLEIPGSVQTPAWSPFLD